MIELLRQYLQNRKVLILGFGREGQSSYRFIQTHFPELALAVADRNPEQFADREKLPENMFFFAGDNYLEAIADFDVILHSPGIQISDIKNRYPDKVWLSQSGLFLEHYHRQIIGVTGTKGKSTTSSLIYYILKKAGKNVLLIGNIGVPPLDLYENIVKDTILVFELSANQLQHLHHSPHIAILLNLFPEHLDYFGSESCYYAAKWNITKFQTDADIFIYDRENEALQRDIGKFNLNSQKAAIDAAMMEPDEGKAAFESLLQSSDLPLKGRHNIKNILAAWMACRQMNLRSDEIILGIKSFKPLEHRLEFVGNYCGIDFYNDSISTIPESTLAALETLGHVHTLILGGHDRGISYSRMLSTIADLQVARILFTGPAGKRMMQEFDPMKHPGQEVIFETRFSDLAAWMGTTPQGMACLLSPAASSYDQFQNFEARGRAFKKMAESLAVSCHQKNKS